MEIVKLKKEFAVCKIKNLQEVPFQQEYVFLCKTDEELSLVCEEEALPKNCLAVEKGWTALKIAGILEFSMVGVIASLSSLLAGAGISIFVISTFNTDYILIKTQQAERALALLKDNGYTIKETKNRHK